jgi:hypothetical protein
LTPLSKLEIAQRENRWNAVSLAGEVAVLSKLAAVFALALLTPAVGADISAHENFVVIWGQSTSASRVRVSSDLSSCTSAGARLDLCREGGPLAGWLLGFDSH